MEKAPGYSRLGNSTSTSRILRSHRSLIMPIFAQSDHMKAICNLVVPVDSKAPKPSSQTEKYSSAKDKSPSHPSPPTPVVGEMHKEAHQAASGPTSLKATSEEGAHPQLSSDSTVEADPRPSAPNDSIPPQQGMNEGTKNTPYDYIFAGSNPNVLVDKSKSARDGLKTKKELEQLKAAAEAEVASLKANPSYPDINQLTTLLVAELKNTQWELPAEFLDLPHLASSVQEKLKTLDSLPGLLKTVTNTLNRFATLVENAPGAPTTGVPSADKAAASLTERRMMLIQTLKMN
nr:hypothetical protein [Tanacetum cinerariifolium]